MHTVIAGYCGSIEFHFIKLKLSHVNYKSSLHCNLIDLSEQCADLSLPKFSCSLQYLHGGITNEDCYDQNFDSLLYIHFPQPESSAMWHGTYLANRLRVILTLIFSLASSFVVFNF